MQREPFLFWSKTCPSQVLFQWICLHPPVLVHTFHFYSRHEIGYLLSSDRQVLNNNKLVFNSSPDQFFSPNRNASLYFSKLAVTSPLWNARFPSFLKFTAFSSRDQNLFTSSLTRIETWAGLWLWNRLLKWQIFTLICSASSIGSSSIGSYLLPHFLHTPVKSFMRHFLQHEWPQPRVTGSTNTVAQKMQDQASVWQVFLLACPEYPSIRLSTNSLMDSIGSLPNLEHRLNTEIASLNFFSLTRDLA